MSYYMIGFLLFSGLFVISHTTSRKSNEHQTNDIRETPGERQARLMAQSPQAISRSSHSQNIEYQLYEELLCMAKRDSALADRLILYEVRRNPNVCRTEHIDAAIWRWRRDMQ
jgi:hypothetical protein